MTEKELNSVRDIAKRIRDLERHIKALRLSAQSLVPKLDGLPHSTEIKSRVEKLALSILADEHELENLRGQLTTKGDELSARLRREVPDLQERTVLLLRYVVCMHFRDIAFQMQTSEATVFRLHHDATEKLIVNDSR